MWGDETKKSPPKIRGAFLGVLLDISILCFAHTIYSPKARQLKLAKHID
ncbi:MAG: hypothetical protein RLZ47_762 [Bacteroidota bacterium]